jgi:ABC-type dipeptide/oligopeptide/nickel transport system ATPase component
MDKIVVMKDGQISEQGTYHELLKDGGQFADFLVEYLAEDDQIPSEPEDLENLKQTLVSFSFISISNRGDFSKLSFGMFGNIFSKCIATFVCGLR